MAGSARKIEKVARIVYGDGGELGSFEVFARELQRGLLAKYAHVTVDYVNRDSAFFRLILSTPPDQEIEELHVFAHSIGAGLFLGYKDPVVGQQRMNAIRAASRTRLGRVTYADVVRTEVGAVQTDDLLLPRWTNQRADLRARFSASASIKIWGCNSGVENWIYSDNGIVDPSDTSEVYYWRAFNERHVPRSSIAQALATFFDRKVYGARSGASIEVKRGGKWISSQDYKDAVGAWPSGRLPHRLVPDKGTYHEYAP